MAQVFLRDDLMLRVQEYAQKVGQTPEMLIAEAVTDLLDESTTEESNALPPYGSHEEEQLLQHLRHTVGIRMKQSGILLSQTISDERDER